MIIHQQTMQIIATAFANGSTHDFRLFKEHHPLTSEQKTANRELACQRIFVEHVIRKVKIFRILSERYRNRRKRFGLRFNLIASLYNLELN